MGNRMYYTLDSIFFEVEELNNLRDLYMNQIDDEMLNIIQDVKLMCSNIARIQKNIGDIDSLLSIFDNLAEIEGEATDILVVIFSLLFENTTLRENEIEEIKEQIIDKLNEPIVLYERVFNKYCDHSSELNEQPSTYIKCIQLGETYSATRNRIKMTAAQLRERVNTTIEENPFY